MKKVILNGHIEVPETDLEAVLRELPRHTQLTLEEAGCIVFEVTQDSANERLFRVYEEFVDQHAFDGHQRRVQTSNWGSITKNVVRHYEITSHQSSE